MCVCVVRPPVTELLPTGLLSDPVLCDDVITDVWSRDPVSGGVRHGSVALYTSTIFCQYLLARRNWYKIYTDSCLRCSANGLSYSVCFLTFVNRFLINNLRQDNASLLIPNSLTFTIYSNIIVLLFLLLLLPLLLSQALDGLSPQYLADGWLPVYQLLADDDDIATCEVPRTHRTLCDRLFTVARPHHCNIRKSPTLATFKKHLKTFLFCKHYGLVLEQ